MSVIDPERLASLLSGFFHLRGGGPTKEELLPRIEAISSIEDIAALDRNPSDPLWIVVPQLVMHRFGVKAFQAFEPHHMVDHSFIFLNPAHQHVVDRLKLCLQQHWTVGEEITLDLSPRLINSLYGGYEWHAAYASGCNYLGYLGKPATIILLPSCNQRSLRRLVDFKNNHRARLSEKLVVPGKLLGQSMNAVIQAFHCPDVIENTRQMLNLGLADLNEITDDHTYNRCS